MEKLSRYIIRASFSQERMQYLADEGMVIYSAKDGNDRKLFDAPEWLAAMYSHVPNLREQMAQYRGLGITIRHFSSIGNHHLNSKSKVKDK